MGLLDAGSNLSVVSFNFCFSQKLPTSNTSAPHSAPHVLCSCTCTCSRARTLAQRARALGRVTPLLPGFRSGRRLLRRDAELLLLREVQPVRGYARSKERLRSPLQRNMKTQRTPSRVSPRVRLGNHTPCLYCHKVTLEEGSGAAARASVAQGSQAARALPSRG